MFHPEIYRSYDIRGVVPNEFDAEEAYHIGRACAVHTKAKRVVVARDLRPSGDEITPRLIEGLVDGGVDVVDIGSSTTPMFYFAVHHLSADGGVMVTASHNPAQYNGIKMTRDHAIPIGGDSGLLDIRDLVKARLWKEGSRGSVSKDSVTEAYLSMIVQDVDAGRLKIVVDAGNGMAGLLLPSYVELVGGTISRLYWDIDMTFPNHEADPLKEENMEDLKKEVVRKHADLGVAFDGDGDRVFFVTEKGDVIPGDISTALIAREILAREKGAGVLYDLRASRTTKEVIEESGGRAVMSKVGHSNIKKQMRAENAVFAGEVSGHFYFTPWYAESGFLALGHMIRMLTEKNVAFSELVAPLMRYAKTQEINFTVQDKEAVLRKLRETFSDADILNLDGITISYDAWWANVRASNTEPLLRLNMEARTNELLNEKRKEIERCIAAT